MNLRCGHVWYSKTRETSMRHTCREPDGEHRHKCICGATPEVSEHEVQD